MILSGAAGQMSIELDISKESKMIGRHHMQRAVATLAAMLGTMAAAHERRVTYEHMAPLDQYLTADRDAEIELARSAAPSSISRDAKVLVLGRHGYETGAEGKNGFVCLVERGFMASFSEPEFWNPKIRGPLCFNPPGVRSILPSVLKRTELILSGLPAAQIIATLKAAYARKELPMPLPGALSYMQSKRQYLNDGAGSWVPHLMFHMPPTDNGDWGANLPGAPIMSGDPAQDGPEPIKIFMVPVRTWSDGTPAPGMDHSHR
jgi:hypothetical protein